MLKKLRKLFQKPPSTVFDDTKQVSWSERFQSLKNIPSLLRMIWKIHPRYATSNVLLRLIRSGLPFAMLYLGKLIIDEVIVQMGLPTEERTFQQVWIWVGLELGLAVSSDVLNRVVSLLDSLLGDLFANASSVMLIEHAATLDLSQFEDSEFYDKLERARRQTLGRTLLMTQVLSQLQDLITMLFLAVGLVVFNPWLILLLVVAVIPAFLGETHFNERGYSLSFSWTPERRELDYLRFTGASDETAKEIKMFGLATFLSDRFRHLSDTFYQKNKRLARQRAAWGSVFALIGSLGYYGAYGFIIFRTVSGELTIGDLTFLSGSFQQLRQRLELVLNRFSSIVDGALYLQDFFDFFAIKPLIAVEGTARSWPADIKDGFVFDNVGFKYPNTDKWVLRNLSFTLHAREKLALVGVNGAGKTTLVKLLARLYDPNEGRILLDGHDLKEYDPKDVRHHIGVIFQDFVRFQMTAGTNIAIGRIEDKDNRPRIEKSAAQSLADAVIEELPGKYDQQIGRKFADGVDLSGGQWQKIALGRAYMRDAQLLILDEPTAALDARAEHEVFERFSELTEGKSAVLISHRFSTVRMADRILVLDGGSLLEVGSHEELLAKQGKYAELFQLQAEGYR